MIASKVERGLSKVEQTLYDTVDSEIDLLRATSRHILSSGGKRVRPRLLFLSYLASGGEDLDSIIDLASAVELVHTATLVHDDINDHSPTRRGKVAVHARWGRTFALLTGDYLFTKVYELMAPYGIELNTIMAEACVRLVEGETLQADAAKSRKIDSETYKRVVSLKTASLFEAAANMGARLAQADETVNNALNSFGYYLGMAFQLMDDVLDIIGDPSAMGKPVGGDLAQGVGALMTQNGKKSWVHSFSQSEPISEQASERDQVQQLVAELRSSGAVELAKAQAMKYADRANQALSSVPYSAAWDELSSLTLLVVEREQ